MQLVGNFRDVIHDVKQNNTERLPDAVQFVSTIRVARAIVDDAKDTTQTVQGRLPVPDGSSVCNRRRMCGRR